MQRWLRPVLLFLTYWTLTLILYRHTLHAHFTDDFLGWVLRLQEQGWSAYWNSFGQNGLYYGYHLFMLGFYQMFGFHSVAWHLYLTALFSLNAVCLFHFAKQLLKWFNYTRATFAAALTALLFLISPYQTENVVWAATVHYQFSLLLFFASCWFLNRWRESYEAKWLWGLMMVFALSLVTLELALVFPGMWFLVFCWKWNGRERLLSLLSFFRTLIPASSLLIALYFLCTRLLHGQFIPHYGAAQHATTLKVGVLLSAYFKYMAKLFGFVHYADYPLREKVYEGIGELWPLITITSLLLLLFLFRLPKSKTATWFLFGCLALSFLALLPVLNLCFMYLARIENDRLSFFATPFMYLLLGFLITRFQYSISLSLSFLLVFCMKSLLGLSTWYWLQTAQLQQKTLETFRWQNRQQVYVLNLPVNFGGVFVYRSAEYFENALDLLASKNMRGKITAVASQNFFEPTDGVVVQATDSLQWKVTKSGWGWFWKDNYGAADYENIAYQFELADGEYMLRFKRPIASGETLIYFANGQWNELTP